MRIRLSWPNLVANRCPTVTLVVPDRTVAPLRPALQQLLACAHPFLAGAADAAGAGLLARLMLPPTIRLVQQAFEDQTRNTAG
ncbi:hypothetical protein ACWEQ8_20840 [Streptomyces noursei]